MGTSGSRSLTRIQSRCPPKHQSSQGWTWGGSAFKLTCVAIGKSQALLECWVRDIGFFPFTLLSRTAITWQLAFVIVNKQVVERGYPKWKPQTFCNLISEVTSHPFGHILFTRSGSFSPAHNQGEEIVQGLGNTRIQGPLGDIRSCLSQGS